MATQTAPTTARRMAVATARFLDSLLPEQRARIEYHYLDVERVYWIHRPQNRHGLPIRDMNAGQRSLACAVMESGLSADAFRKARGIIDHELILAQVEKDEGNVRYRRDPELYYFTVFGDPTGEGPWGWKAEGHHMSLNFSAWGDEVLSTTPLFFGSNPARVRYGASEGLRLLGAREDLAFELLDSLDRSQKSKALLFEKVPFEIITYNATRPMLPPEQGLAASRMSRVQRDILMALASEYVKQAAPDVADGKLETLRAGELDAVYFAWGGATKKGQGHYYNIVGPNFLVEFDNQQNGANHIHSVWRDVHNDFAYDILEERKLLHEVL